MKNIIWYKCLLYAAVALAIGWSLSNKRSVAWLDKVPRFSWTKVSFPYEPDLRDASGLYETFEDIPNPIQGNISGQIPHWLKGRFLKNGPGMFEFGNQDIIEHLFDGMAMIQRYNVDNRNNNTDSTISRKFIESNVLKMNLMEKRYNTLGSWEMPPEWTAKDRLMALINDEIADNSNVAMISLFGHTYATTEITTIHEFNPDTLETIQIIELPKVVPALKDLKVMTPHPMQDPDGTLWNIGMLATPLGPQAGIFKVPPPTTPKERENPWLKTKLVASIPVSQGFAFPYFHSFFMTPNYLVYPEQPYVIGDLFKIMWDFVVKGGSFMGTMYWDKNAMTRFKVVEKNTGKLLPITYVTEPMAYFHVINAHEENNHLIIDAPFSSEATYDFMSLSTLKAPPEELSSIFYDLGKAPRACLRFALPLSTPQFENEVKPIASIGGAKTYLVDSSTVYLHPEYLAPPGQISNVRFEFPAVSPKFQGLRYSTAYGIEFRKGGPVHGSGIVKLDVNKKSFEKKWEDESCYVSEPVYVPRPGSSREEEGVVVSTCLDPSKSKPWTSLVFLTSDLKELGRVEFECLASPASFHGMWVSHQNGDKF